MTASGAADGKLLGISDLHVTHPENRVIVEHLRPESHADWLIVCGDVSDAIEDVVWALSLLSERFACVVWVPGKSRAMDDAGRGGEVARRGALSAPGWKPAGASVL